MRIRFWGTRGSLAKPGPTTLRYGGNTPCVEVRTHDGTLIVLDCGTGAHGLGLALMASGERPLRGHLMLTHTHWDHIQGFPFFAPLFVAGNEWDIYAPGGLGRHLETTLAGQMEYTYFPVTLAQLGATTRYHDLVEGSFAIGDISIATQYLNHPALALGYRVAVGGASLVYSVDHEPHAPAPCGGSGSTQPPPDARPAHAEDRRHVDFLAGADLVIHDAQYTIEEYPQKEGWGHSPAEWVVDYAVAARAKRLALFHHDPLRTDEALDRLVQVCRERVARVGSELEVFAAAEGHVVQLVERETVTTDQASLASCDSPTTESQTVLVADDDPTIVQLLVSTLVREGFRVLTANDGESALRLARAERPALILLDWQMPGLSGVEVTRRLRGDADLEIRNTPVVLITAQTGTANTELGFAAGVTDYLTKPFRPAHVCSRVRAWLLRRGVDARGGEA
jgi:CheY-like chemotaxis protein/phosphoribosyl 1,2-cyclic phosphodiesterase